MAEKDLKPKSTADDIFETSWKQLEKVPTTHPDGTPMTEQEIADAFAAESLSTTPDLLGS